MKKYFTILLFAVIFCFLGSPLNVFASEDSLATTTINARILPTVWYSTLSVTEGDSIKIYAGVQNNSGLNFTGSAVFYVDNIGIATTTFSSIESSLKDVSANWIANPGSHDIQVKIFTNLPVEKILVSYESNKSNIDITRKITKEVIQTVALNVANSIVSKTDNLASEFADKIESWKKPVSSDNDFKSGTILSEDSAKVLGTSTVKVLSSNEKGSKQFDSFFNICMDFLATLIRNWKWTLLVFFIIFLFFKFYS